MKNFIFIACLLFANTLQAQSVLGKWKSIDDETGEAKSHIEIFEKNGKIYGKITKLLLKPSDTICKKCPGKKKDQLLEGMEIIYDLKKKGDEYKGGKILDPESGKEYKCKISLQDDSHLKVRGFIGFALIGRTQIWERL